MISSFLCPCLLKDFLQQFLLSLSLSCIFDFFFFPLLEHSYLLKHAILPLAKKILMTLSPDTLLFFSICLYSKTFFRIESFWYFFDTKHSWETPLLIISNAYLSIPVLIKLSLISLFPHHPRKFGLAKKIKTSMLIKPMVKFQSSLYLIYHSLHWKPFLHFAFRKPSPLLYLFLPTVLATPSLSPSLFSLMLESPDPSLVPLSVSPHTHSLGDRISFNEFKDHPTLTSTKLLSPSKTLLLNSRLIKPPIYLPCPR